METENIINLTEAAQICGTSRASMHSAIKNNRLRHIVISGKKYTTRQWLQEWRDQNTGGRPRKTADIQSESSG